MLGLSTGGGRGMPSIRSFNDAKVNELRVWPSLLIRRTPVALAMNLLIDFYLTFFIVVNDQRCLRSKLLFTLVIEIQ